MTKEHATCCPSCKSSDISEFVYGLIDPGALAELGHRKYVIGGCVISDDSPKYRCNKCGVAFGRLECLEEDEPLE